MRAELLVHLPADVTAGTDRYDAAICALMALQYAAKGSVSLLPALVAPPAEMALDEGWVYHFTRPDEPDRADQPDPAFGCLVIPSLAPMPLPPSTTLPCCLAALLPCCLAALLPCCLAA